MYGINDDSVLLFKWVWRFLTDGSSLWSRFIKAIHGVRGAFGNPNFSNKGSLWLDLIREFLSLNHEGIDLLPLIKKKLGNGTTIAAKMGQPSLDHYFRWFPKGRVEGERYRDLCSITSEVLLPQTLYLLVWPLNASSDFSVSLVRNLIDDALLPKSDVPINWIKLVPIKIIILA
ncbi:hypothetical protein Tco_1109267 [Tanacetum coccineum]